MFKLFRKTFPKQGDVLSRPIEQAAAEKTQADMDALFVAAAYDDSAAERTGYSNYSYWRSTLRVF